VDCSRNVGLSKDREVYDNGVAVVVRDGNADHMAKGDRKFRLKSAGRSWYGYKVHLSETCDAGYPHLITCVQTTDATASDMNQTQVVHEELAHRHLLPQTHLVDAGYVDAGLLVESHERYGVELLGPVSRNNQWQARSLEKAMICQDLKLILRQERPRAHKDIRVSIGRKCAISMHIPSSLFALTRQRVVSALAALCVLVRK
jgi:Transposase DDE domain